MVFFGLLRVPTQCCDLVVPADWGWGRSNKKNNMKNLKWSWRTSHPRFAALSGSWAVAATSTDCLNTWQRHRHYATLLPPRLTIETEPENNNTKSISSRPRKDPRLTIARATRLFRDSKLTSKQLCQHSYNLAVFGENSLRLNAYAKLLSLDEILAQAQKSDKRMQNGNPKSDLDGIPVTIKANIAVGKYWEMPNACSAILAQGVQQTNDTSNHGEECTSDDNVYESDISRRLLRDCGAVIIGITNMDEFGMGSLGINNALRQSTTQLINQKVYSHTYNPIPWMHRIASLRGSQQQLLTGDEGDDDFWLENICKSTPRDPHLIHDEKSLSNLLDEVQYWISGNNYEHCNDDSPLLSPGGLSSGAAVATSHGSCLLAIGTDTGGSLRLPAAWTSTVGFKPTYGTWSKYGVISYASSLDTVGFVTGTPECATIAWRCLRNKRNADSADGDVSGWNGQLCRDPTATVYHKKKKISNDDVRQQSHTSEMNRSSKMTSKPLANIRIGIPTAFSLEEIPPPIASAWSESACTLQNVGGATLVAISDSKLPSEWIKMALASYYVLACAEASSNLSRYDGLRFGMGDEYANDIDSENDAAFRPLLDMTTLERQISATRACGFGEETQRRILAGTSVLSSDRFHTHYEAAAAARAKLSRSLESVFRSSFDDGQNEGDEVDVMLVPTALTFPPKLNLIRGDGVELGGPTAAFANDVMTVPISLGGFPSVSVPVNTIFLDINRCSSIGMQIFSSRGSEDLMLRVANILHST